MQKNQTMNDSSVASAAVAKMVEEDSCRMPLFVDRSAGNHLTMTLLCLQELGATAAEIESFEHDYLAERLPDLPLISQLSTDQMSGSDDIDDDNWTSRLGDSRELANLRHFFRRQLEEKGAQSVLDTCFSELAPWLHYGQAHPLLRIYFSSIFFPSKPELVADGMAYLCVLADSDVDPAAAPLPVSAEQWTPNDLESVWANIHNDKYSPLLSAIQAALATSDKVQKAKDGIDKHPHHDLATVFASGIIPTLGESVQLALVRPGANGVSSFGEQDVEALLPQICRLAVSLFLAVPRGSTLHGVTVTQAVAHLCQDNSLLSPRLQASLLTRIWVWLTGLYIDKNVPPARFRSQEEVDKAETRADWSWDELSRAAIELDQVHIIKLVFSCKWVYEHVCQDAMFRLAAARAIEGDHPWRADVTLRCEAMLDLSDAAMAFRGETKGKAMQHVASLLGDEQEDGPDPWELAWQDRSTPWDVFDQRNAVLEIHTAKVGVPDNARCLVPGCGSGRDVIEIAEGGKGRVVHGLEISETATAVANSNINLPASRAQVFAADFFEYEPHDGINYDFIFDYTFLCALPLELRPAWAAKMAGLVKQNTGQLLTYVWPLMPDPPADNSGPKEPPMGPPYPVSLYDYAIALVPNGFRLEQAEKCELDQDRHGIAACWRRSAQNAQDIAGIHKVYSFWFRGEENSYNFNAVREGFGGESQGRFWMMTVDADVDQAIRDEFLEMFERVTIHDVDAQQRWMNTPRGCMALTLLTDQLTRNMFRGTARSFATDALARDAAQAGLDFYDQWKDSDSSQFRPPLNLCERWFLSLAFTHGEDLDLQNRGIEILEGLRADAIATPEGASAAESVSLSNDLTLSQVEANIGQGKAHAKLIKQYGRFPYRDEILGREPVEGYEPTQRFERSVRHDQEN